MTACVWEGGDRGAPHRVLHLSMLLPTFPPLNFSSSVPPPSPAAPAPAGAGPSSSLMLCTTHMHAHHASIRCCTCVLQRQHVPRDERSNANMSHSLL
eukprot:187647-Chlamydomonas_euryale.AAC.2